MNVAPSVYPIRHEFVCQVLGRAGIHKMTLLLVFVEEADKMNVILHHLCTGNKIWLLLLLPDFTLR